MAKATTKPTDGTEAQAVKAPAPKPPAPKLYYVQTTVREYFETPEQRDAHVKNRPDLSFDQKIKTLQDKNGSESYDPASAVTVIVQIKKLITEEDQENGK